ncbi:MAG: hypothetical protein JSV62_04135 [Promethearchaeota archaeon]|nr:MAG: hypothetical protein JSV62_04135 [Candidatus Lokiarchaeota archaeon]
MFKKELRETIFIIILLIIFSIELIISMYYATINKNLLYAIYFLSSANISLVMVVNIAVLKLLQQHKNNEINILKYMLKLLEEEKENEKRNKS